MEEKNSVQIDRIFNSFMKNNLFKDKYVLQTSYSPDNIPHREAQIEQVASILAPALRGERTSNLFVYGKTGCIAGDSLIYTNNGWKKIKDADSINDLVLSFNIKTKKYEWSHFVYLRFENKSPLLKITLDNGQELVVTQDHPLLSCEMVWKKADEFKLNEEIVFSYNLPSLNNKEISLSMARLLGFTLSDGSLNKRERRVIDSKGYTYNSNKQRFRYFSINNELLTQVQHDILENFKATPQIIYPKNRCSHVNVISQQLCGTLNSFGVPFGNKSSIIQVPQIILESSPVIQREFMKALFSGDGTVSQQTYQIEYYSNSQVFLQQLSCLLHQEGIICKIREKIAKCNGKLFTSYRLYINGQENLIRFFYKIGFYSKIKQERLQKLLEKYVKQMDFKEDSYLTSKIIKIEKTYESFVYDLTVPKNHNFIANGIISHNTGKTLSVQCVRDELLKRNNSEKNNLIIQYINCKLKKVSDTEYRIFAELIKKLGGNVPATGLPTDQVYNRFLELIDDEKKLVILIFDEIDHAVDKISDNFLYNLTRLNSELKNSQISIVGISNNLTFLDELDPRVRSSLSEEELVFPPYNALQLQDILKKRAELAFKTGILEEGVIAKCAAFAAREHGDARRALDLLRIAGELAERGNSNKITLKDIDAANEKIEKDKILDIVKTEPKQFQMTLLAIMKLIEKNKVNEIFTGDVYNMYQELCEKTRTDILTQRRVSEILSEFDMMGIISSSVVSKGRQGRTRIIKLSIPPLLLDKVNTILHESLNLDKEE